MPAAASWLAQYAHKHTCFRPLDFPHLNENFAIITRYSKQLTGFSAMQRQNRPAPPHRVLTLAKNWPGREISTIFKRIHLATIVFRNDQSIFNDGNFYSLYF